MLLHCVSSRLKPAEYMIDRCSLVSRLQKPGTGTGTKLGPVQIGNMMRIRADLPGGYEIILETSMELSALQV